LAIFENLLLK